jgi:hypothetical protein
MSTTTFYNSQNLVGIGSVGIGTTNPGTNIVAINSATTPTNAGIAQFLAPNIISGSQARICLGQRGGSDSATSSDGAYIDYTNYSSAGASKNTFSIGFTQGAADVFFVQSSGNVGIGTTSPGAPLHVTPLAGASTPLNNGVYVYNPTNSASNSAIVAVRIAGASAASAYYSYDVNGVAGYTHGITGASQNLVFRADYAFTSTTIFTMDRSGNFTAAQDVTAYSDRRIKKDIKLIEGALDKVSQIGGYTFTRTDETCKGQKQAGVIAQELLEVLPEVVHVNEETGYYTVSYGNITALLIEALKEEKSKREALEERVTQMQVLLSKVLETVGSPLSLA